MLAAVLGALLFIGGEAKWYSAIARATTITGHAGVVDAERRSARVAPADSEPRRCRRDEQNRAALAGKPPTTT